MIIKRFFSLSLMCIALPALGAEHEIQMLNYADAGGMVFEPGYLQVAPGDTVTFVPTNTGHHVRSHIVPESVEGWESEMDERFSVTLEEQGVYVYYCPPHLMMNMTGVIQVGSEAGNRTEVEEAASALARRAFQNSGRLASYLSEVTWQPE
ncbi:pseudoazurin [Vreelandella boliviensis]|uniref:Pseudoazurin n=1 Tax=Vreelandella boliviensis LC1 TaxID=1072583 RepID=A0A265E2F6_9GAMM|nr:pseudoazurin [Halomonas boliviensis]EHJ93728.1 Putative pseudoazurin [Halomonas boliviensis LC1]OZT75772.1 pseudoazurin [Halomonas boliviensis LC1]